MDLQRRDTLKAGGSLAVFGMLMAAGLISPGTAMAAQGREAFEAKTIADAFARLGAGSPAESADVWLNVPDIADNGAVVTAQVMSHIPGTEQIAILIEKNPYMVAAIFDFPEGTIPEIDTRLRIAESCDVYAVVKANGAFHYARKGVRVTLGGCA
ncbi:MAG TPA: thiosulfate oxidation carrier protein SoxY [Rhodocyclaceae bacterium]|jgi:sulfur-oxidizing protein SoxY|nr:thiosulfate oxidation carrier protein SoxY [Rhodocyclaceae bacterium]HRQ45394.1 thiosulfate oxidation carrier protein SoxY [Rhodocyclaceae bacterium]